MTEPTMNSMFPLNIQTGPKMQCPKFKQQSEITLKQYHIECQLVLITNSKSRTGFYWYRHWWPWM